MKTDLNLDEKAIRNHILDFASLKDIPFEYLENLIDPLFDPLLSSIPIVSIVKGLVKVGLNISEKHFMEKTLIFMKQLESNQDSINNEKINSYREKVLNNEKNTKKELERVIIILNKIVEEEKSIYIANAFIEYVNENIERELFMELITILDSIMLRDLDLIRIMIQGKAKFESNSQKISCNRLVAMGIVNNVELNEIEYSLVDYRLTDLGKAMAWFMLKEGQKPKLKFHL
jgi:hypothetical protein